MDIFSFPKNKKLVIIDSYVTPNIGDFLSDIKGNLIWEIEGLVVDHQGNEEPLYYLNNCNLKSTISVRKISNQNIRLEIGDTYYLKKIPLIR